MNINQYVAQLGELQWSRVLVGGLLAAGVYYVALFDDGTNLRNKYQAANLRLAESEKQLQDTKSAMADADRFEKEVRATQQQLERIVDFMPEDMSAVVLTDIVSKQGASAGVQVTKMEPRSGDEKVEFYEMTRLNLSVQGSYSQIVAFLSYLSRVPRLLTFDKVELALSGGEPESPQVNFVGTLVGYRYVKQLVEGQAADGTMNGANATGNEVNANK